MPNTTGASRAVCPYFRDEGGRTVVCEGIIDGTALHTVFISIRHRNRWRDRVCSNFGYEQACPLAAALTAHYERKEEANP